METPTVTWADYFELEDRETMESIYRDEECDRIIGLIQNNYYRRKTNESM